MSFDIFVRVAAQTKGRIDTTVHLIRGGIFADLGQAGHDGHFTLLRLLHPNHIFGDVDHATQHVPAGRKFARFEDVLRQQGKGHDRNQRQDHGQRAEWKQLLFAVPAREVDERFQADQRLPTGYTEDEADDVGGYASVRVAVLFEVHHHQQLREQNDVDQIRTQVPSRSRAGHVLQFLSWINPQHSSS